MRKAPLDVVDPRSLNGEAMRIRVAEGGFELLGTDGRTVARSTSAKRLSRYAFDAGADNVAHLYDLKLSSEE